MAVSDYSTTPDENVSISGINIAEGCAPSGINNAIRQMMADIKTKTSSMDSAAGANASAITAEETRAKAAEEANATSINNEVTRAKAAEATYLPLAGGTLTGYLGLNDVGSVFYGSTYVAIGAAGNNSSRALFTNSSDSNPNSFLLGAGNGTSIKYLLGKPDGTLLWDGTAISLNGHTHTVSQITDLGTVARPADYGAASCAYQWRDSSSGVKTCGNVINSSTSGAVSVTFPFAFTSVPVVVASINYRTDNIPTNMYDITVFVGNCSTAGFCFWTQRQNGGLIEIPVSYIAIGI